MSEKVCSVRRILPGKPNSDLVVSYSDTGRIEARIWMTLQQATALRDALQAVIAGGVDQICIEKGDDGKLTSATK